MEDKEKLNIKITPKNKLIDLNNILFEELERLNDADLTGADLQEERERARTISTIAQTIINNGELALKTIKHYHEYGKNEEKIPRVLLMTGGEKEDA